MRAMPSSAVLMGSGSASDRTPTPRSDSSCTRLRTSRRLRPIRSRVCTTMVSPGPGVGEQLVQALAVDGGAGLLVDVDPRLGDADVAKFVSVLPSTVLEQDLWNDFRNDECQSPSDFEGGRSRAVPLPRLRVFVGSQQSPTRRRCSDTTCRIASEAAQLGGIRCPALTVISVIGWGW